MGDKDIQEKLLELQDEVCMKIYTYVILRLISYLLQSDQPYLKRSNSLPLRI